MFGATAVRRKRERERREKAARGLEPAIFPFIKPFGQRFDKNKLPYFKYRIRAQQEENKENSLEVRLIMFMYVIIMIELKGPCM